MPHDVKGRLIEPGDVIKVRKYAGAEALAIVTKVDPGSSSCNVNAVIPETKVEAVNYVFTAAEAELIAKADGSLPE